MDLGKIITDNFNLKVTAVSALEGYGSINYKVETEESCYVLKLYEKNKECQELLEAEDRVLEKLQALPYDFPKPIKAQTQTRVLTVDHKLFRLLSYVNGTFLGDSRHSPELLTSFGKFLASMNLALLDSRHAPIAAKESQWDLKQFGKNYPYLEYIPEARDRNLIDYFFLQFDECVRPHRYELRQSIIHNDANDWNVLTCQNQISGIIDFGDMCHSWLINELAVALTYIMMNKEQPLETARHVVQAYHSVLPLHELELDLLYYLIGARLATSVCNSAKSKLDLPDSDYITISEQPAWAMVRKWLEIGPIKAGNAFRDCAGFKKPSYPGMESQLEKRKKQFSASLSLSYKQPIQIRRSAFQYMYDAGGNSFLDAYNNIMLVGHCHPKVVRAGQRAMARLNTNTRYLYEELFAYSEKLLAKFPKELDKIFFVNSGSAASDLAVRLARHYTGRRKLMVVEEGYHGNTSTGIAISPYKYKKLKGTGKNTEVLETPIPKVYGSGMQEGDAARYFADKTLKMLKVHGQDLAGFIAEPIVGCGGQVPLADGYLKAIYPEIRASGGVCISDEVQVGFGRLGDFFWGFEMYDVVPDVVILGKPMANGHPIGAVVTTSAIAERFAEGPEFFSSFGGNPVSCRIGEAVLDVVREEGLQEKAKTVGRFLKRALEDLARRREEIADVRGQGMFLGVEISAADGRPDTELAQKIKNRLREKFILIGTDGPFDNVLKIKPPLSFNQGNATTLTNAIEAILKEN